MHKSKQIGTSVAEIFAKTLWFLKISAWRSYFWIFMRLKSAMSARRTKCVVAIVIAPTTNNIISVASDSLLMPIKSSQGIIFNKNSRIKMESAELCENKKRCETHRHFRTLKKNLKIILSYFFEAFGAWKRGALISTPAP